MAPSDKEFEKRRRNNEIWTAIESSDIPKRYQGLRFKDYKETTRDSTKVKEDCKSFAFTGAFSTGLLMVGQNGNGKTMMACIILNELIMLNPTLTYDVDWATQRTSFRYAEAIKIIRDIKNTWQAKSSEQYAIDQYVRPNVLVIDEIGMQYGSPTEKQFLTEIINDRYNLVRPTILAGNLTPNEIKELLGDRIYDRFNEDGKCLVFNWPSYRLRNKAD